MCEVGEKSQERREGKRRGRHLGVDIPTPNNTMWLLRTITEASPAGHTRTLNTLNARLATSEAYYLLTWSGDL